MSRHTVGGVTVETRTDVAEMREMTNEDHIKQFKEDITSEKNLWRHHPRGIAAFYYTAVVRCFTPHDANNHVRKFALLVLTMMMVAFMGVQAYVAVATQSLSGVINIPLVVLSVVWGLTFMFELGQEVDKLSLGDFVTVDFTNGDD